MLFYIEHVLRFHKFVYFVILQFLISCANSEPGWLKVCNPKEYSLYQNYEVDAENCPNGVWLPQASSLGCICVNGLWVLTNDWCDENYQLVYGHGHCFNVENQVRKISYVGKAENAFETEDYITNTQAHVFHAFNASTSFSKDNNSFFGKGVTVLRINPQKDLKLKWTDPQNGYQSDSVCLKALGKLEDYKEERKSLAIFVLQTPAVGIEIEEECTENSESSEYISKNVIVLKPGKMISVKNGKIVESSEKCDSTCEPERIASHERVKRSKSHKHKSRGSGGMQGRAIGTKAPKKIRILLDLPDSDSIKNRSLGGRSKTNCSDMELTLRDSLLSEEEKMQLVNEETRRALKIETKLLLNGGKGPGIGNTTAAYRHWFLLQNVKKVFLQICPPTQVPPFIVNSLMRLFRYIFIHTRDGNPYGMHFEDKAQDERIRDALVTCFDDGKPFLFLYDTVKHANDCRIDSMNVTKKVHNDITNLDEDVWSLENKTVCKCTEELNAVNFSYPIMNRSDALFYDSNISLNKTIIMLPEKQQHMIIGKNFTIGKHDFVVESIWKIINFAHFFCSRQFQENPQDHSALFDKLEGLFNKEIIFRWTHPGNPLVWKVFYTAYDLEKFVQSLDACVAGAKELSDYPHWLTRPTTQSRAKREVENPVLWDGNGYCMRGKWDPLDNFGLDVPDECREGRSLLR